LEEFQINLVGIQIRAWLYLPEPKYRKLLPVVILSHGIPGSVPDPEDEGYIPVIKSITSQGFCCVFFNFRGCGLSEGNIDMEGWYEDLLSVLDRVYNIPGIDPSSIHFLGFSAGGSVAAKVAAFEDRVKSIMLMSAPSDFSEILPGDPDFLRQYFFEIGLIRDKAFPSDINTWYESFLNLKTFRWLPFLSPRYVCIVHGDKDTLVPPEQAKCLYEAAGEPKKIIMLKDAPHQLRKDDRIKGVIREWLRDVE